MLIIAHVQPSAKKAGITKIGEGGYKIAVREKPINNDANFAVLRAVANYFAVPLSSVRILRGKNARVKYIEIK